LLEPTIVALTKARADFVDAGREPVGLMKAAAVRPSGGF